MGFFFAFGSKTVHGYLFNGNTFFFFISCGLKGIAIHIVDCQQLRQTKIRLKVFTVVVGLGEQWMFLGVFLTAVVDNVVLFLNPGEWEKEWTGSIWNKYTGLSSFSLHFCSVSFSKWQRNSITFKASTDRREISKEPGIASQTGRWVCARNS